MFLTVEDSFDLIYTFLHSLIRPYFTIFYLINVLSIFVGWASITASRFCLIQKKSKFLPFNESQIL